MSTGCGKRKFYLPEHFEEHILKQHRDISTYTCNICSQSIPKESAVYHFLCHGLQSFHCLYCGCGAANIDDMRRHMCNNHPTKLLYSSARKFLNSMRCDPSDINATVIVDIAAEIPSEFKFYQCPYTQHEMNFMTHMLGPNMTKNYIDISQINVQSMQSMQSDHINVVSLTNRLAKSKDIFLTLDDFNRCCV